MNTKNLSYGRQWIDDDDIAEVVKVLKGDWLTQGPTVAAFERSLADYAGVKHAVTFVNGTAALHGAMAAAGLEPRRGARPRTCRPAARWSRRRSPRAISLARGASGRGRP